MTRLSTSVEAAGLIRRAEAEGGFGTVIKKGDPDRGAILLVIRGRDGHVACLERMLDLASGSYRWTEAGPGAGESEQNLAEFLKKRSRFDEDLWLIELDIAQPERFIAETTLAG
jgi:hypothetical protein